MMGTFVEVISRMRVPLALPWKDARRGTTFHVYDAASDISRLNDLELAAFRRKHTRYC
jgi:hypothetical protein